jgi:hypothetical protein
LKDVRHCFVWVVIILAIVVLGVHVFEAGGVIRNLLVA